MRAGSLIYQILRWGITAYLNLNVIIEHEENNKRQPLFNAVLSKRSSSVVLLTVLKKIVCTDLYFIFQMGQQASIYLAFYRYMGFVLPIFIT